MLRIIGLITLAAGIMLCQQTPIKMGPGVTPPKVLQKSDPDYTQEAKAAGIQGPVVLTVTVGDDGVARDIQVKKSLDPGLDANAVSSVQTWKFQPASKDGQAVRVIATIEVNFKLK
jgi:protein TonB